MRRQNQLRQLEDTWPTDGVYIYKISSIVSYIGRTDKEIGFLDLTTTSLTKVHLLESIDRG